MDLDGPLRAQTAVKVERPPALWEADTETEPFLALLGELIALGLGRGNELAGLTLNVANVVVEPDDEDGSIPEGEFVAITVRGGGSWDDDVWRRGAASRRPGLFASVGPAAERAGRSTRTRGTSATRARSPCSSLVCSSPGDTVDPVHVVAHPLADILAVHVHPEFLGDPVRARVLGPDQRDDVVDVQVLERPVPWPPRRPRARCPRPCGRA